jgi:hypothetical protein
MCCKVVVPVDLNDVSARPLKLALDLTKPASGTVVLLAVVDDFFPTPDILSLQLPWADYHRHLRDEADTGWKGPPTGCKAASAQRSVWPPATRRARSFVLPPKRRATRSSWAPTAQRVSNTHSWARSAIR